MLQEIPIGSGEVIKSGEDVAILALGSTVAPALEAADNLAEKGIKATVVNARYAKPLDGVLITDLTVRIKNIVTVEENVLSGGFGSGVLEFLQKAGHCDVRVTNIGIPDEFVVHGTQTILRSKYGLDAAGITRRVLRLFPEHSSIGVEDKAKLPDFHF